MPLPLHVQRPLALLVVPAQDIAACTLVLLASSFRRSPGSLIGWVLVYNIAWMFVLGGIQLLTERFATYRTAQQTRSEHLVNQSLRLRAAS
jgi:hypothetical protein